MKKLLLLGDEDRAMYHKLSEAYPALKATFAGEIELCPSPDDYSPLLDMSLYDGVLSYADLWGEFATEAQARALERYVFGGGALLCLHGGSIMTKTPECARMIGASFTGHPPMRLLEYSVVKNCAVTDGIGSFAVMEEPYRYDFHSPEEIDVLLTYSYDSVAYPAMWTKPYGRGLTASIALGHTRDAFTPAVCALILRAAKWTLGDL